MASVFKQKFNLDWDENWQEARHYLAFRCFISFNSITFLFEDMYLYIYTTQHFQSHIIVFCLWTVYTTQLA